MYPQHADRHPAHSRGTVSICWQVYKDCALFCFGSSTRTFTRLKGGRRPCISLIFEMHWKQQLKIRVTSLLKMGRRFIKSFPQKEQPSPCFLREANSRKYMSHLGPRTTGSFLTSQRPCTPPPNSLLKLLLSTESMLPSQKTEPGTQFKVSSCSQQEYLSKIRH